MRAGAQEMVPHLRLRRQRWALAVRASPWVGRGYDGALQISFPFSPCVAQLVFQCPLPLPLYLAFLNYPPNTPQKPKTCGLAC